MNIEGLDIPGYELQRKLGSGGMSEVYLGLQKSLNRKVAIKVLPRKEGASQEAYRQITDAVPAGDRKAFAMQASQHRYRAILFKMYDGQPYDEIVWKLVRPGPADPFRVEV